MAATAATTAVAATSSLAYIPHSSPAPSAFARLLHRSKFASYDPKVKQVYSSPPASAHRGDFGLKRPLALRRKNAFITVKSVDSRFQQTEWNHGESQVRFVRRFEELHVTPRARGDWKNRLGSTEATQWLVDSEFSQVQWGDRQQTAAAIQSTSAPASLATTQASVWDGAPAPRSAHERRLAAAYSEPLGLTPNFDAMSSTEFNHFLDQLRKARPQFHEFLQSIPEVRGQNMHLIAQNQSANYHGQFLQKQMQKLLGATETSETGGHKAQVEREGELKKLERAIYSDPKHPPTRLIGQKPHRSAALDYTHISPLTTFFLAKAQPGLVLQEKFVDRRKAKGNLNRLLPGQNEIEGSRGYELSFEASFVGMTAMLRASQASGKRPLLDLTSEQGIVPPGSAQDAYAGYFAQQSGPDPFPHEARMQVTRPPTIERAPRVVGSDAEGLKGARLAMEVRVEGPVTEPVGTNHGDHSRHNPHPPGSRKYISNAPPAQQTYYTERPGYNYLTPSSRRVTTQSRQRIIKGRFDFGAAGEGSQAGLIKALQFLSPRSKPSVDDEEL
ncbi:hypothetical protein HGRIS_012679 [Hohenbuehelia grisea]|uniref:Uncharacterized protein n=1 Tax=Hohenbuehelia grisea TaxID=104357 RepID=A0ABR3IT30_9AGAR